MGVSGSEIATCEYEQGVSVEIVIGRKLSGDKITKEKCQTDNPKAAICQEKGGESDITVNMDIGKMYRGGKVRDEM